MVLEMSTLTKLEAAIRAVRKELEPDTPPHVLLLFLAVANAGPEGVSQKKLPGQLDIERTVVSRNIAYLSKFRGLNLPGYGLIEQEIDPAARNNRIIRLSPKGQRFAERLAKILE